MKMSGLGGSNSTHICTPLTPAIETSPVLRFPLRGTFATGSIVYIHTRLRSSARGCALFSLLSFLISTIKNMRSYDLHYQQDFLQNLAGCADLVCLAVLTLFLIKLYECKLALDKAYSAGLSTTYTIWTDRKARFYMGIEIALVTMTSPPVYNPVYDYNSLGLHRQVTLDDTMYPWCLVRLYHVIRFLYLESEFCSEKSLFRLSIVKLKPNVWFYVKHLALRRYVIYSFVVIGLLIVISGLVMIVYERSLPDSPFQSPTTSFYCSGITMATIGYGDVLPSSFIGRAVLVLVAILGNYAQAILTLGVYSATSLTSAERTLAGEIYKKRFKEKGLRVAAVSYLQQWWKLHFMRKHKLGNRFFQLQMLKLAKTHFKKEILKVGYGAGLVFAQTILHFDKNFTRGIAETKAILTLDVSIFRASAELLNCNLKLYRDLNSLRRKTSKISAVTSSASSSRRSSVSFTPRLSYSLHFPQRRKPVESTGLRTHRARRKVLARKNERLMSANSSLDL